jgi:hypothetical protein
MTGGREITAKLALIRCLIRKHRLHVQPIGDAGAVRVTGVGVDVSAAGMQWLNPCDVTPIHSKRPTEDTSS